MKLIALSRGMFAKVDDEDFPLLSQFKWSVWKSPKGGFYAQRGVWDGTRTHSIYMHRWIVNAPKGSEVDHRDLDGLNNQKSNLRVATKSQNMRNKGTLKKDKKAFKGVYRRRHNNRCFSVIAADGVTHHLGFFDSEVEAAIAYNKAAVSLHGEFARLNVIPKEDGA